jgi:gamma-glutamylcyclotransferase (GGCT)/AIG2-like uncharacterized protein YtfP
MEGSEHTLPLFVYGILKRQEDGHNPMMERAGAEFQYEVSVPGYSVYTSGGVGFMAHDGEGNIRGEVWAVPSASIHRIDSIEGIHNGRSYGLYRRELVNDEHGASVFAYVTSREPWMVRVGDVWTYEKAQAAVAALHRHEGRWQRVFDGLTNLRTERDG